MSAARRAVIADGADITLALYGDDADPLGVLVLGPHHAVSLAGDLLQAARRRFGEAPRELSPIEAAAYSGVP